MTHSPEDAFLAAFDEYADGLFRHACFRIADREQAKDLVQDTFLKAWDHVRESGEVRHWKGFLYHILRNLIIDEYRKKKEVSLDELLEHESVRVDVVFAVEGRADQEEQFDAAQSAEQVRALIAELPELDREALTLRYIDGFSPKEIAGHLDISENAASVRVHRAVERLKKRLGFPADPHL